MSTLYRPVLIETVAQSYALLHGTVAIRDDRLPRVLHSGTPGPHWLTGAQAPGYVHPADMLGWTALVPVEAEDERTRPVQLYISAVHVAPPSSATKPSRRLVTPWEEA